MSGEETRLGVIALIVFVSYTALVFHGKLRSQPRRKQ
jgi:hypothetical protein